MRVIYLFIYLSKTVKNYCYFYTAFILLFLLFVYSFIHSFIPLFNFINLFISKQKMPKTVCHCRILFFGFQYYFQLSFRYFVILWLLGHFSAYNSTICLMKYCRIKGTNINTVYAYLAMYFYLFISDLIWLYFQTSATHNSKIIIKEYSRI